MNRFSSPLNSERVNPYFMDQMIEEQREANKRAIIQTFISSYWSKTMQLPDLDEIQETFYHLDLDDDMIKYELMNY